VQTNKATETVPEKGPMVGMVGMLNKDFITTIRKRFKEIKEDMRSTRKMIYEQTEISIKTVKPKGKLK
jgi:hypothetical protein